MTDRVAAGGPQGQDPPLLTPPRVVRRQSAWFGNQYKTVRVLGCLPFGRRRPRNRQEAEGAGFRQGWLFGVPIAAQSRAARKKSALLQAVGRLVTKLRSVNFIAARTTRPPAAAAGTPGEFQMMLSVTWDRPSHGERGSSGWQRCGPAQPSFVADVPLLRKDRQKTRLWQKHVLAKTRSGWSPCGPSRFATQELQSVARIESAALQLGLA